MTDPSSWTEGAAEHKFLPALLSFERLVAPPEPGAAVLNTNGELTDRMRGRFPLRKVVVHLTCAIYLRVWDGAVADGFLYSAAYCVEGSEFLVTHL